MLKQLLQFLQECLKAVLLVLLFSIQIVANAQWKKYDVIELSFPFAINKSTNPFTDVSLTLIVTEPGGRTKTVEGFCDAENGSVYKVRFMPVEVGKHSYRATLVSHGKQQEKTGFFTVSSSAANGPVRVDKDYPWHMVYEGTGQHYFWNSTTCYWLLGWKEEAIIRSAIDRFALYGINRIRVAINGRQDDGRRWHEPLVKESPQFTFLLSPWKAKNPSSLDHPGFDVSRFNVAHWQKLDRLITYAKGKGIVVSLIFYVDGLEHGTDPFKREKMGGEDERRYYAYAAARYSAFDNIMWDITNEYHLFRTVDWVNKMGPFLKEKDINSHLLRFMVLPIFRSGRRPL
jgi:hypothetical protein